MTKRTGFTLDPFYARQRRFYEASIVACVVFAALSLPLLLDAAFTWSWRPGVAGLIMWVFAAACGLLAGIWEDERGAPPRVVPKKLRNQLDVDADPEFLEMQQVLREKFLEHKAGMTDEMPKLVSAEELREEIERETRRQR